MQKFVPAESVPQLAEICHLAATQGGVATEPVEQPLQRVNGERFDANVRCTSVVFDGLPSLQFSFTDVSAQKAEEELRLRSRKLEALGTLAGGIAHDFNNILLAIRGNAELVAMDSALSSAGAEHIREIQAAGQRASELVRRITAFARPEEHRRERVQLPDVLHEVLRLLRPTVPAGISLQVVVADDVPPILADAAQVHETIVNLTTNAVYAIGRSDVGQVTFTIDRVEMRGEQARRAGVSEGRFSRLTVRDTGNGMDAGIQRRVFDAFYTTKPVGQGTGLGLSMAYGTMRSHGGAITVESKPGEGATFHLLFPSLDGDAQPLADTTTAKTPEPRTFRVLFVDDEPQLVQLAQRALTRLGHTVTSFTDPCEALRVFREAPRAFDVIMTDLSMPRMSGLDLAKAVRETRADVPIVMVTGYADDTDELAAKAAGVSHVAVKGSEAHQFSRLLAAVV
jgi:signal transduction histidine kinase/CheY-like chemotaxis protein